ncbi:DNA-binding MarR family transcriptional regulator [Arthrobacter silviterrae]|uniref:MarR family transcriptional regulator n=1 Tax=Arthrobacter silviterrae TaxID=2026658 RepID=A0ABX0DDD3_9MICC|nr:MULTISPECIES: MarR family transcriptional regulator [Arthrobacter]MCU6481007.1 MarR family transcriptional regulator [Arthrobacter sp. A2-55]MDQ0278066.1 DNA-binding MarR family transcriptional regulator [Arthrobacter silviterrae]NGN84942.1 MarR family transcriptional regulator [Arthrobacter silviterrae]
MANFGGSADLGELFHAAFRGLRRTWAEQLAPWELTPHQWRALQTLVRGCGPGAGSGAGSAAGASAAGLRLKDLADRLRIAPRSATEVVDQLESKDLVRRDADPSDRRATLVVATPAGEQLFAEVSAARRDKSMEYFAQLAEPDRTELARILAQLSH